MLLSDRQGPRNKKLEYTYTPLLVKYVCFEYHIIHVVIVHTRQITL